MEAKEASLRCPFKRWVKLPREKELDTIRCTDRQCQRSWSWSVVAALCYSGVWYCALIIRLLWPGCINVRRRVVRNRKKQTVSINYRFYTPDIFAQDWTKINQTISAYIHQKSLSQWSSSYGFGSQRIVGLGKVVGNEIILLLVFIVSDAGGLWLSHHSSTYY